MIRINNVKIYEDIANEELFNIIVNKYKIPKESVTEWHISKKSIDARKKDDIHYSYSIDINLKNEEKYLKYKNVSKLDKFIENKIEYNLNKSTIPVIIGAGPSGLFSALTFIKYGYKPLIIEQGQSVEERKLSVDNFIASGKLNINSNVQFGEGGAGTFSDGKLTSNINSPHCRTVLDNFLKFENTYYLYLV